MVKAFPRAKESLGPIHEFVDAFLTENDVDRVVGFPMNLVIEELFTNFVRHDPEGGDEVEISLEREGRSVTIKLIHFDATEFDVTTLPPLEDPKLEELRGGGFGVALVKKITESLEYDHTEGNSVITAKMRLVPLGDTNCST